MREATDEDYKLLQGGRPEVQYKDGLWHICHNYMEGAPLVRTHRDPRGQSVVIWLRGRPLIFQTMEVWEFEGLPCELESISRGGEGYERVFTPSLAVRPRPL